MAEQRRLDMAVVQQQVTGLHEFLSKADADRLHAVLACFSSPQEKQVSLAACLAAVASGSSLDKQLADFRAFRQRLHKASSRAGLGWRLQVDTRKRATPQERWCWFSASAAGPVVDTAAEVAAFGEQVVASLPMDTLVEARAGVSVGPPLVRLFVSYDESDAPLAKDLLQLLHKDFQASRKYECETWDSSQILVGENQRAALTAALQQADFGLLLLSVAWLGKFDPRGDLRDLVIEHGKPVILVVLREFDPERHNLHGLEGYQLFRLHTPRGALKSFAACRSEEKHEFVLQLCSQIEQRLDRRRAQPVTAPPELESFATLMHAFAAEDPDRIVDARMLEASLRSSLDDALDAKGTERSVKAIAALETWALDPEGTPYCAILGEYGMGKTTTLKQFTHRLLEQRRAGKTVPLPIFMDLRLYSHTVHRGEVPDLETLLQEMLDRVWESPARPSFRARDVVRLVREEGAILIFDGLDEKLVHLDETQGRAFLRTLWHALPPTTVRQRRRQQHDDQGRPGRLIFSCRSHYFKTLREQNAMLRGEDRDGIGEELYRAWVLLPFEEAQIRDYLGRVLGAEQVEAALDLCESVHNLRELAQRPYLLALISKYIGALEQRRACGEVVYGVILYGLLVDEWLGRDGGKHQWRPEDKLRLMEDMAAAMWQEAAQEWEWERVLEWLGRCLAHDAVLRTRYANVAPALLEEDFRTATFVLRPDRSQQNFRFAHTSLQEYFLARFLLRAAVEQAPERWVMPLPSPETLDFLGQLLATTPGPRQQRAVQMLEGLLGTYQPQATDMALRYWLRATANNFPQPAPGHVDLHGADLSGLHIQGQSPAQPLLWTGANLSQARLLGTRFTHVDLCAADLTRTQAEGAEFHQVLARDILLQEADMTAAIWRQSDTLGLRGGHSAAWYGCQWLDCAVDLVALPEDFGRQGVCTGQHVAPVIPDAQQTEATTVFGHTGAVWACSYAPDGTQVASGADDRTVKLWDVRSGQCLRTLTGHTGAVRACSYAPDGTQVASGAGDGTVKLWDVRSGQCLRTLHGHTDWVWACSYAPDGTQVASGAGDGTVKLWDVRSGQCLRTLHGHTDWVWACSYAPDGTQVVSGAGDGTVKLWDVRSGQCLRTLTGHTGAVMACSYAPDGTQVVSGGHDGTVKLWDVRSGQCLRTLHGHTDWVRACSYAPDGTQVASGAGDGTVKLWDVRSGQCLRTLTGHTGAVWACSYAPDGTQVVSGAGDGTVKLWDVRSGQCLRTLSGHAGGVRACSYAPDGTQVASGAGDGTVKLWDVRSGQCLRTLTGHTDWVQACSYAPDGTQVASGADDGTVKLWDVRSGQCLRTLHGHTDWVQACSYAPDGTQVASGAGDGTVKLWDVRSGQCLRTLTGHTGAVMACSYAPDGTQVVSGGHDGTVKLWDVRSGQCLRTLTGHAGGVWACSYAPDGTQVASGADDGTVKLWDVRSGQCLRTLHGHTDWVRACSYAPDGTQVASGVGDGTVKLWDVRSGQCLRTLTGHTGAVMACSYAPDGTQVVSGALDGIVKLWDVRSGEECLTLIHGPDGQTAALDYRHNRILAASPEAWRFLGWRYFDPDTKRLRILPAEYFGPLPPG